MKDSRIKKLKINTISSLIFQITTLVCGFIIPRMILESYGSELNGLVNSITQFLHVISFLELGVGSVVQSALYKPLVDEDSISLSKILLSAEKFFRKIALILLGYITVLVIIYPTHVKTRFDIWFSAILIVIIGASSFAQYYFGMVDRLLLISDQKGYIQYTAQTLTLVTNTIACCFLILIGAEFTIVKLSTAVIYLVRPIFLRWYVNKHYSIDRKIKYEEEPIKQKWNGLAQHIAAVLLDGTDTIVLTVFSTLSNVSIYSVYHMVLYGIKNLFLSMTTGVKSLIGELWAKQDLISLEKTFAWFEWAIHTGTIFVFGCTATLIVPFVSVYTNGVDDANYIQPLFAAVITVAHGIHCLRLPYSVMILAAGHYKQTQSNYIIAAIINIAVSIVTVIVFGLVGVAVGTLVAMLYQTVWMAYYISKNLNKWPFKNFIKQIFVDIITVLIAVIATCWIKLVDVDYVSWIFMAIKVATVWIIVIAGVNTLLYREKTSSLIKKLIKLK